MDNTEIYNKKYAKEKEEADILNYLGSIAECARDQASDKDLKFIAHLFDMVRIECINESKKL